MHNANTQPFPVRQAFKACRSAFIGAGAISLVINVLMLSGPIFMLLVYDRVLSSRSLPTLAALAALVGALYIFFAILDGLRARILLRIGQSLDNRLTLPAFGATLDRALVTSTKDSPRLDPLDDLERVRRFFAGSGPVALFDLPWMPIYLGLVFALHPTLGLVAICGALVMIALVGANEAGARAPQETLAASEAERHALMQNAQANAEAVAAMGMRPALQSLWTAAQEHYLQVQRRAGDRASLHNTLIKAFRLALQSAVLGIGAWLAVNQEISAGVMIATSIITARALAPVEQAVANWRGFVAARQGLARLALALDQSSSMPPAVALPSPREKLEIGKLVVGPPGAGKPILRGIGFSLKAGDGLAVIGPSGSGKSTLARALTNIWPANSGDIRLDGAELRQWSVQDMGRAVGYLPQDVQLFAGSVADNIARFQSDATSDEIIAAAKLAQAHDLITALDDGYDTQIGSAGARLSGGQRQRIALARAFFRKPFLIVLDEPNAHLDADGEAALVRAIAAMRQAGSILIVVAHRPSVITALNHVLVLAEGRQVAFKEAQQGANGRAPERQSPGPQTPENRSKPLNMTSRPGVSMTDASSPGASSPGLLRVNVHG